MKNFKKNELNLDDQALLEEFDHVYKYKMNDSRKTSKHEENAPSISTFTYKQREYEFPLKSQNPLDYHEKSRKALMN